MPSKTKQNIDPAWDEVVRRAMQPDREERFANAAEMIAAIQVIRSIIPTATDPASPGEMLPSLAGQQISPVGELPFDSEPEDFPGGRTPLPANTPTAAGDSHVFLEERESRPGDTDPLLEEEEDQDIPSWMLKRRDQADSLEDTQAHMLEEDSASALEEPAPGIMDSSMHLERQAEAAPETPDGIPLANVADLEDWLSPGPAPGGIDSSQLIEVSAHLAPTRDEVSEDAEIADPPEAASDADSSDVLPLSAPSPAAEPMEPSPVTGTSGILTTEETTEKESAASLPPEGEEEELPEGDFVELCYDAWQSPAAQGDKAILFRPAVRPPTVKILVLDDGSGKQGEWFRVRKSSFVIGRKEGDIVIEYDRSISGRHAEIYLKEPGPGIFEFMIRDLNTTNGTFARASRATLEDGQEFLLGYRRYKLVCNCLDKPKSPPFDKLMEINKKGTGKAFRLGKPPVIIGRDPTRCNLLILDDPFLSPVHAVMKRDSNNRWAIKNYNSRNGIWIQIEEMKLVSGGEFQIAGQSR
jgi:pSer/pThr/pTyr-binding forkhead associated (FHA) protein